jgi:hypothetical protein
MAFGRNSLASVSGLFSSPRLSRRGLLAAAGAAALLPSFGILSAFGRNSSDSQWYARENQQHVGYLLIITGIIPFDNTNQEPRLTEVAAAIGRKVLVLNLEIETVERVGAKLSGIKAARFEKEVAPNQYSRVYIQQGGRTVARCEVENDAQALRRLVAGTRAKHRWLIG